MKNKCNKCGQGLEVGTNWTVGCCVNRTYTCSTCRATYQKEYHLKNRSKRNEKSRVHYQTNKTTLLPKMREANVKKKYGLSISEYDSKMKLECSICSSNVDKVLDHDHTTNKIRGTLCRTCNAALGLFKDNKTLLLNATRYLNENA